MSRILIVDDDHDILKFCQTVLAPSGHEVVTVSDVQSALHLLQTHTTDLLIVDVMMPVATGFDLLQSLKRMPNFKAKILMLTARRKPADVMKALELGATDYICKPLDKNVLVSKVQTILGKQPEGAAVRFAVGAAQSDATMTLATVIESVSEMGMTLRTACSLGVSFRLKVETPLFDEIGIVPPILRVAGCKEMKIENGSTYYEVFISFIGLEESAMSKIRQWVTQRTVSLRKTA